MFYGGSGCYLVIQRVSKTQVKNHLLFFVQSILLFLNENKEKARFQLMLIGWFCDIIKKSNGGEGDERRYNTSTSA